MSGLHIENLQTDFLQSASFDVMPGTLLGIVGPNGAGKTTLIKAVLGLLTTQGTVTWNDANVRHMSAVERARHISYLPTERDIAWPLVVEAVVALGRYPHGDAGLSTGKTAIHRAMQVLDITHFSSRSVTSLSSGERARVLLARTLAGDAGCMLVDEPIANLDPAYQLHILTILQAEARLGKTILVVLHDLALAERFCDQLLVMDNGVMVAFGEASETLSPQILANIFRLRQGSKGLDLLPQGNVA